jgi:integrase
MATKRGKTKHGNGEGSVTQRPDGRWEERLTLEGDRRKSFYAKTRQEAARLLRAALQDRDAGLPVAEGKQIVSQFIATWLEKVRPSLKPKTYRTYEQLLRVHVLPTVGSTPLTKLTAEQLQRLYAVRLSAGSSTTTVHHVHAAIHRALASALRLGLVQRNVSDLTDPPPIRRNESHELTAPQVQTLLEAARGERLEALFILAVTTGMRQGELLALKWADVDLEQGALTVRATLQTEKGGGFMFAQPKTARSRRRIVLTATAVESLRQHRVRQAEERLWVGPAWDDLGLVLTNAIGRPLDGVHVLRRNLRPLLAKVGLPPIQFHDLRHSAATLFLGKGVHPKVVAEVLGHSQVSITLDVYSHVLPDMQESAATAMEAVLKLAHAPRLPDSSPDRDGQSSQQVCFGSRW